MSSCSVTPELADEIATAQQFDKDVFKTPLVQSLMKTISIPLMKSPFELNIPLEIKAEKERIIAGYASVELIDKQNEIIPLETLKKAWNRFIKNPDFMHVQFAHTSIPIGKIIMDCPKLKKKSGVDENGLFIIVKVRNDIKKADEVWYLISKGEMKYFSIGGESLHRSIICEGRCYTKIDDMELHEVSIVPNPANKASEFMVIKSMGKIIKLDEVLKALPQGMVLVKDFINLVGSVPEKGQSTNDFDLQVKEDLQSEFLDRALKTRFKKILPESHVFLGDPQGPHDTFVPVYDLVLLKRQPIEKVDMTIRKGVVQKLCPQGKYPKKKTDETAKSILKTLNEMQLGMDLLKTKENLKSLVKDDPRFLPLLKADSSIIVNTVQRDGKPAPFASIDVFYEARFLFWTFERHIASKTSNFQGKAFFKVPRDTRIIIKARWRGQRRTSRITFLSSTGSEKFTF